MVFQCKCGDVANYERNGSRLCYRCFQKSDEQKGINLKQLKEEIMEGKTIYSYQNLQTIELSELFEIIDKFVKRSKNE